MANTFTVTHQNVAGNFRVLIGTLTMTDGGGGDSANVGLNNIYGCVANTVSGLSRLTHTGGYINAVSASTAQTLEVIIFGC